MIYTKIGAAWFETEGAAGPFLVVDQPGWADLVAQDKRERHMVPESSGRPTLDSCKLSLNLIKSRNVNE